MRRDLATIRSLFDELLRAPLQAFPAHREELCAPKQQGVYVIYCPKGQVLHVGATPKAKNGIAQRLRNHMSAKSSFVRQYLNGDGSQLRKDTCSGASLWRTGASALCWKRLQLGISAQLTLVMAAR